MFGCSAIMSTGMGVASFGLYFEEASFAAPHRVQLRRHRKVVAPLGISGRHRGSPRLAPNRWSCGTALASLSGGSG